MLDEDAIAARIHGIHISESSDDSSAVGSNSETDEEIERLRPPPLPIREEDIVKVPAFTFVSYKRNRHNKPNYVNKNFNKAVANSSHNKKMSKIVKNKKNVSTNGNGSINNIVQNSSKVTTSFVKTKARQKVLSSQLCNLKQPVENCTYANIVRANSNNLSELVQSNKSVSTNHETDIKTNVKRKRRKNKKKALSNNLTNANATESNCVTSTTTAEIATCK